jgi:hypothetical protein
MREYTSFNQLKKKVQLFLRRKSRMKDFNK